MHYIISIVATYIGVYDLWNQGVNKNEYVNNRKHKPFFYV